MYIIEYFEKWFTHVRGFISKAEVQTNLYVAITRQDDDFIRYTVVNYL